MAFLNLKKSPLKLEQLEHARYQTELHVSVTSDESVKILEQLRTLTAAEGSEIRIDLNDSWTLFWKLRSGESRLLLAHPEQDQWVGTVALAPEHLEVVLQQLFSGGKVSLSRLFPIARMSNLEVSFTLL